MYWITNISGRDIHFLTFNLLKGERKLISEFDEACNHSLITNCVRMKSVKISKVEKPKIISEPLIKEKARKPRKTKKGN